MTIWLKDPKDGSPSVTLTILILFTVLLAVAAMFQVFGKVNNTSCLMEIFFSTSALYLGRRLNFGGKTYSSDKAEEIITKVENK